MFDFSDKTFEKLLKAKLQMLPDSIDKSEGTLEYVAMAPNSYELAEYYAILNLLQLQGYYKTATGKCLEYIVAIRNIVRQKATYAVKRGVFNIEVPIGNRFSTLESNLIYVVDEYISAGVGVYYYKMKCETAGVIGNSYTGDLLAVDFVNGLTSATLDNIIITAQDEETDENLRARFELSMKEQEFGGNIVAYKNKIESIDGVGLCQVYPAKQYLGGSTCLCVIVDDLYAPATQILIDTVQATIAPIMTGETEPSDLGTGYAPVGAKAKIATGTSLAINITCDITFESGSASEYQTAIENKVKAYIASVMSGWATWTITTQVNYVVQLLRARFIQYILEVEGVMNVANLRMNGADADLTLQEDKNKQEIAVFGSVVING